MYGIEECHRRYTGGQIGHHEQIVQDFCVTVLANALLVLVTLQA